MFKITCYTCLITYERLLKFHFVRPCICTNIFIGNLLSWYITWFSFSFFFFSFFIYTLKMLYSFKNKCYWNTWTSHNTWSHYISHITYISSDKDTQYFSIIHLLSTIWFIIELKKLWFILLPRISLPFQAFWIFK